jgi:hypothetical protein
VLDDVQLTPAGAWKCDDTAISPEGRIDDALSLVVVNPKVPPGERSTPKDDSRRDWGSSLAFLAKRARSVQERADGSLRSVSGIGSVDSEAAQSGAINVSNPFMSSVKKDVDSHFYVIDAKCADIANSKTSSYLCEMKARLGLSERVRSTMGGARAARAGEEELDNEAGSGARRAPTPDLERCTTARAPTRGSPATP